MGIRSFLRIYFLAIIFLGLIPLCTHHVLQRLTSLTQMGEIINLSKSLLIYLFEKSYITFFVDIQKCYSYHEENYGVIENIKHTHTYSNLTETFMMDYPLSDKLHKLWGGYFYHLLCSFPIFTEIFCHIMTHNIAQISVSFMCDHKKTQNLPLLYKYFFNINIHIFATYTYPNILQSKNRL